MISSQCTKLTQLTQFLVYIFLEQLCIYLESIVQQCVDLVQGYAGDEPSAVQTLVEELPEAAEATHQQVNLLTGRTQDLAP